MKAKSLHGKGGRRKVFPAGNTVKQNAARAVFGKNDNERKRLIFQIVALWPKSVKEFQGRYADNKGRIHPAIEALLDILVPALCRREAIPFNIFAESTEMIAHPVAFLALNLACELTGYARPFNADGLESLTEIVHRVTADPYSTSPVSYYPETFRVPITQADFLRKIKDHSPGQQIDAGNFHRLCQNLKITFAKDPQKGGRKPRSSVL
jgi:hypothetical protein